MLVSSVIKSDKDVDFGDAFIIQLMCLPLKPYFLSQRTAVWLVLWYESHNKPNTEENMSTHKQFSINVVKAKESKNIMSRSRNILTIKKKHSQPQLKLVLVNAIFVTSRGVNLSFYRGLSLSGTRYEIKRRTKRWKFSTHSRELKIVIRFGISKHLFEITYGLLYRKQTGDHRKDKTLHMVLKNVK